MLKPIIITNFKSPYLQEYDEAENQKETEITFHNKRWCLKFQEYLLLYSSKA